MMNKHKVLTTIVFFFIIIGCHNTKKQTAHPTKIYYKNFITGKIAGSRQHQVMVDSLSEKFNFNEQVISKKTTSDSTIVLYADFKMPKDIVNPYKKAQKYIGEELPFSTLKSIHGDQINIKHNNGKPTLINLWFTTCPPCIKEIPQLNKLQENYGDKVNFIAITFNSREKVESFLKKKDFNFTQAVDAQKQINKIGTGAYPINFFTGKNNKVFYVFGNSPNESYFENILEKLL